MEIFKYLIFSLIIISALVILTLAAKTKKAFKFLFLNILFGFFVFFAVYFTKKYTGVFLPLNMYTAVGVLIFGVPFIVAFLLLNLIL